MEGAKNTVGEREEQELGMLGIKASEAGNIRPLYIHCVGRKCY